MPIDTRGWSVHEYWSPAVKEIYCRAAAAIEEVMNADDSSLILPAWEALGYGPAHIVWADDNLDCCQTCIDWISAGTYCDQGWPKLVYEIVRQSLIELQALPESEKDIPDEE